MAQQESSRVFGVKTLLLSCIFCLISGGLLWGQGTAQLHGIVRDPTGAVVTGADVRATQTDTGAVRTITTGSDGGYVLTDLPLGPYKIEISKQGFTTYVQTGIVLQVASAPAVDATLQVGTTAQQVVVESNAPLVETRTSAIGQLVETQRILDMPLNGRQSTDLITLSGAAVQNGAASSVGRTILGVPVIQVAGGMSSAVGYQLDGANHFNYASATTNLMPFPDALQEFKVDTSGVSAQQGAYAVVSAVTRSGSNAFHGDVFEFLRNGVFNGRNYFAPKRDDLKRNQFGGVIGGPITKDKLFFFAGYQGTTLRSANPITQAFIPTAAMMAGDWSTYESPACNFGVQKRLTGPYVNNQINPAAYNPVGLNLINRILATAPTPNQCGSVLYSQPIHVNDHQIVGRMDYQMSARNSFFGRYMAVKRSAPPASQLTSDLLASTANGESDLMQSGVLGWTAVINPNMVNSLRISTTRLWWESLVGPYFSGCDLGMNMYCGYDPQRLTVFMGNAFTIGQHIGDHSVVETQNFNLNEDITIIHGTHQFSFGGNPRLDYMHQNDCFFCKGILVGSASTGSFLSDLLVGKAAVFAQAARYRSAARVWHWNLYATDTWRATPKLTLSYGVRWEPFTPETLLDRNVAGFDWNRFNKVQTSTVHPGAAPGITYPGDPGFPNGLKGMNNHWAQFAPHVGVAWDPKGDGKTSVRASYGMSYNQIGAHMHDDQTQQAPFINLVNIPVATISNPWAILGFNPHPGTVGTVPPFSEQTALPYDMKQPYTSTWNLSVQRQFGENWMLSLAYLGSETTHMWTERPLNYVSCPPGTAGTVCNVGSERNFRILNEQHPGLNAGAMLLVDPSGTSSYNGMLFNAQKRFSQHFSLQSNYTWSHCISDFDPDPTVQAGEDDYMWTNPLNRRFDRGDCIGDRRHAINLTAAASTPKLGAGAWQRIASEWQLAPMFRWSSGQPLNVVTNGLPSAPGAGPDPALNGSWDPIKGSAYQRPNCVAGANPYGSSGPSGQYLNPAAFSFQAVGTLGNCPFNGFHAPAFWQFDAALSRTFSLTERQHIEFRMEAFNLLNKFRPGYCNVLTAGCQFLFNPYLGQTTFNSSFTLLNSPTFGQIRSAMDPRIMQFALKYVF